MGVSVPVLIDTCYRNVNVANDRIDILILSGFYLILVSCAKIATA